jgi:conserved oligomeric Golgi complex subunit 5
MSMDSGPGFGGGPSVYIKELVDKLHFIKAELLSKYSIPEESRTWSVTVL